MAKICVYCGSSTGSDPDFAAAARTVGSSIARGGHELFYGGGDVGLMGIVANAVLEGGGKVTGVITELLMEKEVAHRGLSELVVVPSMHERKAKMLSLADCFIALPGATGTLEEIIEAFVWTQLDIHRKVCGLLDVNGFYQHLVRFLGVMCESRLMKESQLSQLVVSSDAGQIVEEVLAAEIEPVDKWLG